MHQSRDRLPVPLFFFFFAGPQVPMFALKSVTDLVDGGEVTSEEFLKNLGTAAKSLQETLPKVLAFIAEKPFASA